MKKIVTLILSLTMVLAIAMPVSAAETSLTRDVVVIENEDISLLATNYFTGSTVKMNSINGQKSTISTISSGSVIGSNPQVTTVSLNVTVSSGSSSFKLYVEDPNGNWDYQTVSRSGSCSFNSFSGVNPSGKWKVYIVTNGTVSTATARITVNYTY